MTITICIGSSCHLKGSRSVIGRMDTLLTTHNLKDRVTLNGSFCMDDCANGVCVTIDEDHFSVSPETVDAFFEKEVLGRLNA